MIQIAHEPKSVSELLRRVVKDMRRVKNHGVEFNMLQWASPEYGDRACQVCAAGAYALAECSSSIQDLGDIELERLLEIIEHEVSETDTMTFIDDVRSGYLLDDINSYPTLDFLTVEAVTIINDAFDFMVSRNDYNAFDYKDVVKWFNTVATILEREGY